MLQVSQPRTAQNTILALQGEPSRKDGTNITLIFNNQEDRNKTTLSAHVWKLKDEGRPYEIQWDIMDRAKTFNPISRKCRLCLKEIFYIMFKPESATLNSRNELYNTCRHRKQKLLNPKK